LDPRAEKLVVSHGSMVHVPTPQSTQYRDLVNWLEEDFKEGDRVVLITEKGARQSVVSTVMKEAMDSSSLEYKTFSYSILEGRDVSKPLTELMSSMGTNRILISSESEAFVNDVIRNLNLLIYNNIDITIYASSKIRGFETIEVENLHKTSMHVSLAYYIDYENTKVKDFLKKYRALYNTEPNQFAFQGYDVARYFIELCARYGYNWKQFIEDNDSSTLQSMFKIRKQAIGGYTNSGVRRIVYENGYSVKPVR
jgi:ABC-type branched-subunit amino acid transport system substrate-binding protein